MKKLYSVLLLVLIFSLSAKSQEQLNQTYRITDNGSVQNIQPYIDALNNANMKYHRLKNSRNTIIFEKGVKVELFSATELVASGKNINLSDYPENFDSSRQEPVFSLGQNNFIMEMHNPVDKFH